MSGNPPPFATDFLSLSGFWTAPPWPLSTHCSALVDRVNNDKVDKVDKDKNKVDKDKNKVEKMKKAGFCQLLPGPFLPTAYCSQLTYGPAVFHPALSNDVWDMGGAGNTKEEMSEATEDFEI